MNCIFIYVVKRVVFQNLDNCLNNIVKLKFFLIQKRLHSRLYFIFYSILIRCVVVEKSVPKKWSFCYTNALRREAHFPSKMAPLNKQKEKIIVKAAGAKVTKNNLFVFIYKQLKKPKILNSLIYTRKCLL